MKLRIIEKNGRFYPQVFNNVRSYDKRWLGFSVGEYGAKHIFFLKQDRAEEFIELIENSSVVQREQKKITSTKVVFEQEV